MNYNKHYATLIERARHRVLKEYTEKHHIIPRCLGGSDDKENIVALTPEEHYVAHQLLVKMHPKEHKLVYAANMMTVSSRKNLRSNKQYGWIKKRYISECRKRKGSENSSYGKPWYYNPETLENGKFLKENVPIGWIKGRKSTQKHCTGCLVKITSQHAKYCQGCLTKLQLSRVTKNELEFLKRKDKFISLIEEGYAFSTALDKMGYGNSYSLKSGVGKWAKEVLYASGTGY